MNSSWLVLGIVGSVLIARPCRLNAQSLPSASRDSALHALNRLAFGPRPGEVDRVAAEGVMRWIERQLEPGHIDDPRIADRERAVTVIGMSPEDLADRFEAARRERQERQAAMCNADTIAADAMPPPPREQALRQLIGQYQELAVVRAVLSERQLETVLTDFWFNHFNVFLGKGVDRFLVPSYIEATIRPRVLGRFEDLLIATARSPAMLFYLDNWQSVAPGSVPPSLNRMRLRVGRTGIRRGLLFPDPGDRDSLRRQVLNRMPQGLNENYARELLELHTLGVDGGYTQQDVIAVARIFTGWSIDRPQRGGGFVFNEWAHDFGEKTVLGVVFPAGHGEDEGIRLLKLLAASHATMHHVSRRLCARFVADDPPDGCVDDAVDAWHRSGGDLREVLRAIVHSSDFWAPRNSGNMVKTPLEFVASAARALGADPDSTPRLAQVVARLGEPLFQHVAPDGYPEREEDWVNSGALLNRMNAAVQLAAGRLPGVTVNVDSLVPDTVAAPAELATAVDRTLFAGTLSDHTRQVITQQVADMKNPVQARALAIGLALGGPDFQRR